MRRAEDWLLDHLGDRPDDFAPGEREIALRFILRVQADAVRELVEAIDSSTYVDRGERFPSFLEDVPLVAMQKAWVEARAVLARVP
jgi:hypothetical protein